MTYTCPMHPEIEQDKPGNCPKCGMKLVLKDDSKTVSHSDNPSESYTPLIIIVGLILLVTFTISLKDFQSGAFSLYKTISYFMAGFFLIFSSFKLMDLKGFAEGYSTYDLLAQKWFGYGYIYPFLELFFGLAMILNFKPTLVLLAEIIVMTFS